MSEPAEPLGPDESSRAADADARRSEGSSGAGTSGPGTSGAGTSGPGTSGAGTSGAAAPLPPRPPQRRGFRPDEDDEPVRPSGDDRGGSKSPGLLRELPILVFVALALALLIKTFLVQAFYIPSDSMQNTLVRGDRVLVNKLASHFGDVSRGQVVVFRDPGGWLPPDQQAPDRNPILDSLKDVFVFVGLLPSDNEQDLIKRVIGVPGDTVACCTNDGAVTVNGVPLDEPYLFPGDEPSEQEFEVTVPPNRLWVMGDHRSLSADSRVHQENPGMGTIPADNVVGRAFVIVWPLADWSTLPIPETFNQAALDGAALTSGAVFGGVPLLYLRRRRRRRPGGT